MTAPESLSSLGWHIAHLHGAGELFPGSRAECCTSSPGASQASWIHFNLPFQHQRWPLLETGAGEDGSLSLSWRGSSYVLFHRKGCDQQKLCQRRSLASLWAMGLFRWFVQPRLFLLLLKCDVGWQLCGISHMEALLCRDGRNWTNCGGFSHMGPIHAWWTPVEAAGAAPAERLTRHIHWFIVVLLSGLKHSKFSP